MKNEKQINIFIPKEIAFKLKEDANKKYVTTTALIRNILINYVKENTTDLGGGSNES